MMTRCLFIISCFAITSLIAYGQDVIATKADYAKIIQSDNELLTIYKSKNALSNKATILGVISIFSAGLTGFSGVLHYEANEDTSKALTSLPVRFFGTITIITGILGTAQYFFSKSEQRKIEQMFLTKYNSRIELTFTSPNVQYGMGISYVF